MKMPQYCKAREPETLTYEAIVSEDDPNLLVIYERYTSPEALSISHNSSAQFKAFGKWLAESDLVLEKHKETFWESGVGYASR
jgi:quinol monooxygenase YgiN